MKVNVNFGKTAIVSDVLRGECFVYDLDFYMRVRSDKTEEVRAVNLSTGNIAYFTPSTEVRPIACEVNERKD